MAKCPETKGASGEGEVSIFLEERTYLGHWVLVDDLMVVTTADASKSGPVGSLRGHPEVLARLLLVQIAKERFRRMIEAKSEGKSDTLSSSAHLPVADAMS